MINSELKEIMHSHKICVILPTYNNAGTLGVVVEDVLRYCGDVIVVNDGSTDSTSEILNKFRGDVDIVSYSRNKGKGGALREGFRHAIKRGFDYAITIDTDGQHFADDIPNFVRAIIEHPGSLIIGARDLSGVDINGKSSFANKFSNFWFTVQTGKRLPDTQTGYRAYPLKNLYGLSLLTSRYEAELELLVFAAWNGVEIISIPIRVYYPPQSERVSHFRPGLDFTRISILNTILCFGAIIYGLPARLTASFKSKKIFGREWECFTHKDGKRRDAAVTIGRLLRSFYGLSFFIFWSVFVLTPYAFLTLGCGKQTEKKRLNLHRRLQGISRYIVSHYPGGKTIYENLDENLFEKPSLIVCNHQSHLDLPLIMATWPKLVFLTNDWVWNNKFFGRTIRYAEYLPVSEGIDKILPKLENLTERGYSIVVFPEGTRSEDCRINRFHQGAFLLAQKLQTDIMPMVIHGAGHYLPKKDFMFRRATVTLKILDKVGQEELTDTPLRKQASYFRKLLQKEYSEIARRIEKSDYFRSLLLYKYAYRGWPVVVRCKSVLSKHKEIAPIIDSLHSGNIAILNCGYGVFALWFALVNKDVEVYAFEESLKEYRIAEATSNLPANLHFKHSVEPYYKDSTLIYDECIVLEGPISAHSAQSNVIRLNIRS